MNINDVSLDFFRKEDLLKLNYVLDNVQEQFTSTIDFALNRIEERKQNGDCSGFPVTIHFQHEPVGFFVLDTGEDKSALSENENAVLLRSLSINPKFQGRGIGIGAMQKVVNYITAHFPKVNEIVLTVNINNESARRIYIKDGYHFSGQTKEGRNGLQEVLKKKI